MEINQIFSDFTDSVGHVVIYARAAKKLTNKELEELEKQTEAYNKRLEEYPDWFSAFDRMYFQCPKSGETKLYFNSVDSLQDRKDKVWLHRNKNYQWLLAEAYEAFEVFIARLYTYIGKTEPSYWQMQDFGTAKLNEIEQKPFEWYYERAKKKKDFPKSILNAFRDLCPEIDVYEKNNSSEVNMRLTLKLIEKFRHLIVHNGGVLGDLEEVHKKVVRECGFSDKSADSDIAMQYLKSLVMPIKGKFTIVLMEKDLNGYPNGVVSNTFENLVKRLVAYSSLLSEEVSSLVARKV